MHLYIKARLRPALPKQAAAIRYLTRMYRMGRGGLLFKEMRLGKTLTFIRFAKVLGLIGPFLIVCPNAVKDTWANELRAEREYDYVILSGDKEDKIETLTKDFKWYIVNFEAIIPTLKPKKDQKIIRTGIDVCEYQWFAVVVDESVKLADSKSDTAKYLLRYFPHVQFKYCLCGNPIPEHELQYVQQFIFVFGHFMGYKDLWHFEKAHYDEINYQKIPKMGTRQAIYKYVHEWAFVCSRKEAGLGSVKIRSIRFVGMTPKQKEAYNLIQQNWEYKGVTTKYAVVKNGMLRDVASGFDISTSDQWFSDLKLKEINYLLSTELKKQQIIIWCKEKHEADYLHKNLSRKYRTRLINGDVKREIRESYRQDFHKGIYQIQIATIKSLAKGTDWSCADTAIYFSEEFGADDVSQSEDRVIHPLKKGGVLLIYLQTKGTVDEDIHDMNVNKMINSSFFMSHLQERINKRAA